MLVIIIKTISDYVQDTSWNIYGFIFFYMSIFKEKVIQMILLQCKVYHHCHFGGFASHILLFFLVWCYNALTENLLNNSFE